MKTEPVIEADRLTKQFGAETALRNVSLKVPRGTIVGLVGANGAGKSTLMRIMTGIYLPDSGSCKTLGTTAGDLGSAQLSRIGYVHQEGKLIGWMYVKQLIRFVAGHYPGRWNKRLEEEDVQRFRIPLDVKVSTLSPGKRQQLAILLAVGFEPELLVLDEPAAGLDPLARFEFLQLLLDLIQNPERTILISSHILSDIEQIIDHVVIFKDGSIVRDCAFDALQEEFVQLQVSGSEEALSRLNSVSGKVHLESRGRQALLVLRRECYEPEVFRQRNHCDSIELPLNFEGIYRLVVAPGSYRHQPMGLTS
jgi:ABC-2 type transport system ATP-binding protein